MSAFSTCLAEFASVCAASIRRTFSAHLPLYVCALLFVPITAVTCYAYEAPLKFEVILFFLYIGPKVTAVGVFIVGVVQVVRLARGGSRSPLREFRNWAYSYAVADDRLGNIVHSVVTITPLLLSFAALKEIIPLIRPFSWDPTFEQWDRLLGFGYAPWELLQPIIGYPIVTMIIDLAYALWFLFLVIVLIWQAFFAAASVTRIQYLLAFALCWFIGGNILAVAFASVGPCYYGFLHSPDPYAAQLNYLREASREWPLIATQVQHRLWTSYTEGVNIGISAMPSLHVVIAVLAALVARRSSKLLGVIFTVYSAIIVIGSVHLAWHYAVDGIMGIAVAILLWHVAGVLVRAKGISPVLEPRYSSARAREI